MRADGNVFIRARRLRKRMSLPEVKLWRCLRGRGDGKPVFRRQHPLGPYVLDFYCPSARLCIEVDGQSHGFGDRPERDERRDRYLNHHGIRTIRVAASEVISGADWIAEGLIAQACARAHRPLHPSGPPPPQAGEV
jgi:very-short-patch-repair endonuclease